MQKQKLGERWDVYISGEIVSETPLYLTPTPQPGHPTEPQAGDHLNIEYHTNARASGTVIARSGNDVEIDIQGRGIFKIKRAEAGHPAAGQRPMSGMETFVWVFV